MPKIVVDDHGGERTDPGMLGSGIYFAKASRYCERIWRLVSSGTPCTDCSVVCMWHGQKSDRSTAAVIHMIHV